MGLVIALLLLTAPPVADDAPRTYGALTKTLPRDKAAKATALVRFARDERASATDRGRAARAAVGLVGRDQGERIALELLVARIEGVRGRASARRAALVNARRLAEKSKDTRLDAVVASLAADDAAAALTRAVRRHKKGAPLDERERVLLAVEEHATPLVTVDDAPAAARLCAAAALLAEKGGALDDALSLSERAIALAGTSRDATLVVDDALRLRARALASRGELARAAEESLRADVRDVTAPSESAFFAKPPRAHLRSRASADLCFALLLEGGSCRDVEKKLGVAPTFYDFSVEKSTDGFDPERGEVALSEAQDHLFACVKKAAQAKDFGARRLEIEWTVLHSGRAKKLALKPTRLAGTPVDQCIDEALTRVRYPRYDGELHHVVLPFDIGG